MKGYKTIIVNGAAVLIPIIGFFLDNGAMAASVLGPYGAGAISILGLVNIVLRWVTTTPVLKSE